MRKPHLLARFFFYPIEDSHGLNPLKPEAGHRIGDLAQARLGFKVDFQPIWGEFHGISRNILVEAICNAEAPDFQGRITPPLCPAPPGGHYPRLIMENSSDQLSCDYIPSNGLFVG